MYKDSINIHSWFKREHLQETTNRGREDRNCHGPRVSLAGSVLGNMFFCCFMRSVYLSLSSVWAELITGSCLWPTHLSLIATPAAHLLQS